MSNKKKIGDILLINYNDSTFMKTCRETKALILDARNGGKSRNTATSSDNLAAAFDTRYKLVPQLSVKPGETPEEFIAKAKPIAKIIKKMVNDGNSVIITTFSPNLLKIIGFLVQKEESRTRIFYRWENNDSGESGIYVLSKQKEEEIMEKLELLCERYGNFQDSGTTENVNTYF